MSNPLESFKYSLVKTLSSSEKFRQHLIDYATLIQRESSHSVIKSNISAVIIDMDYYIRNNTNPPLKSMDFTMVCNDKQNKEYFILVDCKLNIENPRNAHKNISNKQIKEKYTNTKKQIEKVSPIPCYNTAIFLFRDDKFEQLRNRWSRKTLEDPKNTPIKLSDFEKIF